jgi:hypothetical protein
MSDKPESAFERAALEPAGGNIVREFWDFLRQNKKWWLLPLLALILLQALLLLLSGSAAAPFIYPLF